MRRHRRRQPGRTEPPGRSRETRIAVFGDSDFAANLGIGIEGNADLFLNTVNWLVAAGEPHRHPAEAARRPARDADRRAAALGRLVLGPPAAGGRHRRRRLHLVEAAGMNRGRNTLLLLVLGLGLGAYIYFVEMKREPASDTPEAKLGQGLHERRRRKDRGSPGQGERRRPDDAAEGEQRVDDCRAGRGLGRRQRSVGPRARACRRSRSSASSTSSRRSSTPTG